MVFAVLSGKFSLNSMFYYLYRHCLYVYKRGIKSEKNSCIFKINRCRLIVHRAYLMLVQSTQRNNMEEIKLNLVQFKCMFS